VLDRESMVSIVESLCVAAEFQPGDRVKTLRGSTCGVVQEVLDDGRVVWRPDGTKVELTALPQSLLRNR
jgi:transcription elongation factor